MPSLRVQPPDRAPFEVELRGELFRIGRSAQNDLAIPTLSLSRNHAQLSRNGVAWRIEDCGSRNGTFVNQKQVSGQQDLRDGDEIRMGDVLIFFRVGHEASSVELRPGSALTRGDETYILRKEDMSFHRFAQESRSGEVPGAEASDLWPALSEAAATLITHYPIQALLDVIMDIVFRAVPAQRGALLLRREEGEGEGLEPRVVRQPPGQPPLQISSTIVQQVMERQQAVLTLDAMTDDRFEQAKSIRIQGIRSVLCVPLWNERAVIGLIYVDNLLSDRAFSHSDLRLLGLIANMAAVKVENSRLLEEQIEKERLDEQINVAAKIQARLLPQSDPEIPGYEVRGLTRSCYEIGGDYFDFIWRGDRRLALVIADVSGKGVGAALLMAAFQSAVRTLAPGELDPAGMVNRLNQVLCENSPPEKFVTAFYGELDLEAHTLTYVNAGHNPPLVLGAEGLRQLAPTGPVIGVIAQARFRAQTQQFRAGDLLVVYTDGITEGENVGGEELGIERLGEFFTGRSEQSIDQLTQGLNERLAEFTRGAPVKDDCTLILLRRLAHEPGLLAVGS
jgi:serine phosphatase RsbU (regulator of sigma subunit)